MRAKVAKALRREIKAVYEAGNVQIPWESYQALKAGNGTQQIILVECQKALYREAKKEYYRDDKEKHV